MKTQAVIDMLVETSRQKVDRANQHIEEYSRERDRLIERAKGLYPEFDKLMKKDMSLSETFLRYDGGVGRRQVYDESGHVFSTAIHSIDMMETQTHAWVDDTTRDLVWSSLSSIRKDIKALADQSDNIHKEVNEIDREVGRETAVKNRLEAFIATMEAINDEA